jgi:hypothetical protein
MVASKYPKPSPVVVYVRCALCDCDWNAHGDDPTTLDCIRLLKQRNNLQPYPIWNQPWSPHIRTFGQAAHGIQVSDHTTYTPTNAVETKTPKVV